MPYTSYDVKPVRGLPAHALAYRVQQGQKLRSMYRSLGWSRADCAEFLHLGERCLRNWETGRREIPFWAFKLLRLHCGYELRAGWGYQPAHQRPRRLRICEFTKSLVAPMPAQHAA